MSNGFYPNAEKLDRNQPAHKNWKTFVTHQENGEWRVKLSGNQGSGVLRSMADANCFIVLPEESGSVAAGEMVEVQPFEGLL